MRKPGTLCCILCRGMVQYRNRDNSKFIKHMENEHGAYFDLDFILATCFMDEDEKTAVKNVIDTKNEDEDQVEVEETLAEVSVKRERTEEVDVEEKPAKVVKTEMTNASAEIVIFNCTQCSQTFEKKEHLMNHVKTTHSKAEPQKKTDWYCLDCDQYFCRKDALRIHRGRKHNGVLPEYMTPEARKERKRKNCEKTPEKDEKASEKEKTPEKEEKTPEKELKSPENEQSMADKPNSCQLCDSHFSSIGNLKKHERKFHVDQWNLTTTDQFSCVSCDIKYSSFAALTNHNKWKHGDLSPAANPPPPPEPEPATSELLKCSACDKTFTRKDNLNKHIKNLHPDGGDKNPFKCVHCDFYSPRRDRVEQHMEAEHIQPDEVPTVPSSDYWRDRVAQLEDTVEKVTKAEVEQQEQEAKVEQIKKEDQLMKAEKVEQVELMKPEAAPSIHPGVEAVVASALAQAPAPAPRDVSSSKYFRMNSYAICSLADYTSGRLEDFRRCLDLPEGWSFRYCGPPDNPEKSTHFVTPDMMVIKSRLGAVEYLRMTGAFTRRQLLDFATSLHVPEKRFDKLF